MTELAMDIALSGLETSGKETQRFDWEFKWCCRVHLEVGWYSRYTGDLDGILVPLLVVYSCSCFMLPPWTECKLSWESYGISPSPAVHYTAGEICCLEVANITLVYILDISFVISFISAGADCNPGAEWVKRQC